MSDIRADNDPELDEDHLPWLEAVEEEDRRQGPSLAKILVSLVIGLIILGLGITGFYWLRNGPQGGASGPELIEAEKGDYKVKPADPGGMKVEGSGETSFAASGGAEPSGKLNMDAVPEAPVTRPPPPAPAPAPAPAPPPTKAATPKPAPPPPAKVEPEAPLPAGSQSIQLGAFNSAAIANSAWKSLSTRFKYLEPLSHSVTPVTVNGRQFYRLRATGPDAKALCGRLRVAGESCIQVN